MFSDCLQVVVIENNGSGDDPDDVRYGHRSRGLCHENADNPGPCHENIVRNVRVTTYGDGAANILIALLGVSRVGPIGQKTVSNALANCHCSCQWPQKSNVYISVPGSKLQSKLDNSEDR